MANTVMQLKWWTSACRMGKKYVSIIVEINSRQPIEVIFRLISTGLLSFYATTNNNRLDSETVLEKNIELVQCYNGGR